MLFFLYRVMKRRNPLVLAPNKSVDLQARWKPSVGGAPVSSKSDAGVTALPHSHALPTVTPMPSVGQAGIGAQGMPLDVIEQPAMEAIPLQTSGRMELPSALVAPTMVGAT